MDKDQLERALLSGYLMGKLCALSVQEELSSEGLKHLIDIIYHDPSNTMDNIPRDMHPIDKQIFDVLMDKFKEEDTENHIKDKL